MSRNPDLRQGVLWASTPEPMARDPRHSWPLCYGPFWVNIYQRSQKGKPMTKRHRWWRREEADYAAARRENAGFAPRAYVIKVIPK